jgi:hypothetical protein
VSQQTQSWLARITATGGQVKAPVLKFAAGGAVIVSLCQNV